MFRFALLIDRQAPMTWRLSSMQSVVCLSRDCIVSLMRLRAPAVESSFFSVFSYRFV